MWPLLLDMTEEESIQSLRHLELEAYSSLVSALRAQGSLSSDKRKLLKETSILLSISNDRHKAEVRRAISDERLNTIAYHITGQFNSVEDWAQEGRRLVPLLPRIPPQTPYSVIADDASETAVHHNKQLPLPINTERKRPSTPQTLNSSVPSTEPVGKPQIFRIPDVPKEESKKRKTQCVSENSSLAQHLLGPKLSKIQQIYRQASKSTKQKQRDYLTETEALDQIKSNYVQTQHVSNLPNNNNSPISHNAPKINIIQNVTIPKEEPVLPEDISNKDIDHLLSVNENQAPVLKAGIIKPNSLTKQSINTYLVDSDQTVDTAKLCITKKQINKGQKLIVVSNAQTLTSNSILQKTLSVPMNKLTKINLEKFKIVPNNHLSPSMHVTNVLNNQINANLKPKMVTIKGNSGKKIIPLSQLQMLNKKGSLKVVPFSGKMIDKNISLANIKPESVPKRAVMPVQASHIENVKQNVSNVSQSVPLNEKAGLNGLMGNGENSVDVEMKDDDYQQTDVESNELELESNETLSAESSEPSDVASIDDNYTDNALCEIDNYEFIENHPDTEILEEFEVIHSEQLIQ